MTKVIKNTNQIPRYGWITQLAKEAGCHRITVTNALFRGSKGVKADKVRQLFNKKYKNE